MNVVILDQVETFIWSLTDTEIAKVVHTLELLETFGHELGLPHSRHMQNGLLELRVSGKRPVRILYGFHKQSAVLLQAFVKKTQQTPKSELDLARKKLAQL